MVMMNVTMDDYKLKRNKSRPEPKINMSGFNNEEKEKQYTDATKSIEADGSPQEKWKTIVVKCKKAGEEIFGKGKRNAIVNDPTLTKLSEMKQKIKLDINSTKDQDIRKRKCEELKSIKSRRI